MKKRAPTVFAITLTIIAGTGIGGFAFANLGANPFRVSGPVRGPIAARNGGASSGQQLDIVPSNFPSGSPSSAEAAPSPPADPSLYISPALRAIPTGGVNRMIVLTDKDAGKTLHVEVGTTFRLAYEYDGKTWSNSFDLAVLAYAGPMAQLTAVGKGQTVLHSGGSPYCAQSCPTHDFATTIVVD